MNKCPNILEHLDRGYINVGGHKYFQHKNLAIDYFHYNFVEHPNIPKMLSLWSQANHNPLAAFFDDVS
jgi:hypothetical protein